MNTTLPSLLSVLGTEPIITGGSVAAELRLRGYSDSAGVLYNLKEPVLVESIHRDFMEAGARLIQTNTEGANHIALEKIGAADKVYEINRKGVWIARCAALHQAWVAGVIGPVGKFMTPVGNVLPVNARRAFTDQAIALIDGGCDVIMLRSFIDIDELEIAIEAVRFVDANKPIIALKTFPEDGGVLAGHFPSVVAERLSRHNVLAYGTNGTVGPQRMISVLQALAKKAEHPLCALPDIGIPTLIEGIPIYNAEPGYVAKAARKLVENGAAIIGADGGATVEHIRAIAQEVQGAVIGSVKHEVKVKEPAPPPVGSVDRFPDFYGKLGKKYLATVELDIPRGLDMSSVLEGAQWLAERGIDAVNISDGARARLRMSPIVISHMVQQQAGIEAICHMACRDRNMVGLQSELLGAWSLGVRSVLAVTGDPAQIGDYPYATSVYDIDSIGLIRALARMNEGEDLMSNAIGEPTGFCISCACNPVADDLDREIRRLERKAAEGAHVAFSQPIFDVRSLEVFREKTAHIPIRFMVGVIPLRSLRHAEFLHYEVPGMTIPKWTRDRMATVADSAADSATVGIELAVEFLEKAKAMSDGVYLMPPFKKYSMAIDILSALSLLPDATVESSC